MADEIRDAFNTTYQDGPVGSPTEPPKSAVRSIGGIIQNEVDGLDTRVSAVESTVGGLPGEIDGLSDRVDAVEAIAEAGIAWTSNSIAVRSTANVDLASGLVNGATLNGVVLATGNYVFLGSQTAPAQNGLYTVVAAGAASRASFADTAAEIAHIGFVVQAGTVGTGERWTLAMNAADITLGTTALIFSLAGIEPGYAAEVEAARNEYATLGGRLDAIAVVSGEVVDTVALLPDVVDAFTGLPSSTKAASDNSSTSNLAVSISGGLRLAPASSTGYAGLLLFDQTDGPFAVEIDVTFTTSSGAASRGVGFGVGSGAARHWYAWSASGSILDRQQDGSTITTNYGTVTSRIFAQADAFTVGLVINKDRSGFLTLTLPNGTKHSCWIASIPTGPLYLNCFGVTGNIFTATQMRTTGKLSAEKINTADLGIEDDSDPLNSLFAREQSGNASGAPLEYSAAPIAGNKLLMIHATGSNAHPCVVETTLTSTPAPIRISAKYKLLVSGTAAWAVMAIGEGTGRHFIIYSITGGVVVFDNNAVALFTVGATAAQVYGVGDTVEITLDILPGRAGVLSLTTPGGGVVRYTYPGTVPVGGVAVGMKAATAGVSYEISDVEWTGSASRLATLNQTPRAPATFISYTPLPSIAGGAPSGGFTCTGLDKITSGTYAGCWLVGSDGRTTDASPGSFNAEVLIMSPDFRTILVKFTLGVALTSVQGVTFNKATGNSFWAALTNDLTIRHYYLSGVNAGTEIVADRITWVHGGDGPTGLAYVQGSNALWVSDPASSTVRLLSCVGGGVLTSFTITLANRDQLHFDETNGLLYFSVGANGADGYAYVVDINNTALGAQIAYGPIKYFQAPEGLYIDRETGIATFLSDGGFHLIAIPTLNIAIFCKVALLAA